MVLHSELLLIGRTFILKEIENTMKSKNLLFYKLTAFVMSVCRFVGSDIPIAGT